MSKTSSFHILGGKFCLRTSILVYKIAKTTGSVPFELIRGHERELRIRFSPGYWQLIKWYMVNTAVHGWTMWLTFTLIYHYIADGFTSDIPVHSMLLGQNLINSMFHFTLFEDPGTAMELINQLSLNRIKYDSKDSDGQPIRVWYTVPIAYLAIPYLGAALMPLFPAALSVLLLVQPDVPYFIYYYLPVGWKNMGMRCASCLFQYYVMLTGVTILEYFWVFWNESIFQTLIWLEEIRKGSRNHSELGKWIQSYKRVLLLSIIHNDFNGKYFTPLFYALMVLLCTVYGYLALTVFSIVPIFIYIVYPLLSIFCGFILTVFCAYHAKWSIKSTSVLHELEKQAGLYEGLDKEQVRRQVGALMNVRNQVGPFGYTQEGTGQSLMDQVFNYLLLMLSS